MTYDDLIARALTRPDVTEDLHPKRESVVRGGRWMFSLREDGETVVLKLNWSDHDRLLAAHPLAIFKTPHYEGYPAFLVRLDRLTLELAEELVDASWTDAPEKARMIRP